MLFPLYEILELEVRNKYSWLFNIVNVRPAARLLSNKGSVGRDGSIKSSVVEGLIAQQVEEIPSQTKLIQRLEDDLYLLHNILDLIHLFGLILLPCKS